MLRAKLTCLTLRAKSGRYASQIITDLRQLEACVTLKKYMGFFDDLFSALDPDKIEETVTGALDAVESKITNAADTVEQGADKAQQIADVVDKHLPK